ncbi:4-aminobutyrate aminotransferase PuuE [Carnimonas sp. R-84981]|uniref:4-aminobutyrate--2-oxoglutarate transaminase n=1 Tax=Carnimonas bestiolae TaxID=3402172 RepID=UPI003EDBD17C
MNNDQLRDLRQQHVSNGVGVMCNFHAADAKNAEIYDTDGNRYIDFAAGIAVLNTGHRHPKLVAAIQEQLGHFTHTAYQIVPYAGYATLAQKITQRADGDFDKKAAFFTTGAEAVENAIKVAKIATGRSAIIAFDGAFHGRTAATLALTGKTRPYKIGAGPQVGEVYRAPFPNELHGVSVDDSIGAIEQLFKTDVEPQRVAAIIFEPVQGEGGFNPAPAEFVARLRQLCDQHGIVMIADEVQCGFARTGKFFAMQHFAESADITTYAKSLAGGMPLSGIVGRAELLDKPIPGSLGGTYAGNPLAIASAHAVIDVIEEEKLLERANQLGQTLTDKLHHLAETHAQLKCVRGLGSMIAAEFFNSEGHPDSEFTNRIQQHALKRGLLLLTCGVYGNVIRFLYPLTIEDAIFEEALGILQEAVAEAAQ